MTQIEDTLRKALNEIQVMAGQIAHIREQLRLTRKFMNDLSDLAEEAPELNMSNYNEDEVSHLNDTMVQVCLHLRAALAEAGGVES